MIHCLSITTTAYGQDISCLPFTGLATYDGQARGKAKRPSSGKTVESKGVASAARSRGSLQVVKALGFPVRSPRVSGPGRVNMKRPKITRSGALLVSREPDLNGLIQNSPIGVISEML